MHFDSTITLSIVLGISAIIAPLITSFLNNKHDTEVKKLDFEQQKEIKKLDFQQKNEEAHHDYVNKLIEEFLTSLALLYTDKNITNIQHFQISIFKLRPYIPKKFDKDFQNLVNSYSEDDWKLSNIDEIIENIKRMIKKDI